MSKTYLNEKANLNSLLLALVINVTPMHHICQQHHLDEKRCCDDRNGCGRNSQREEVEEEIPCVEGTNAVVDPHTVVIETVYTDIAKT